MSASSPGPAGSLLITGCALLLVKSGKVEEIFDRLIWDGEPKGVVEGFVSVGILRAHVMAAFRPKIAWALKMLEGNINIQRPPDRPLPLSQGSLPSFSCHGLLSLTAETGSRSSTVDMD